MGVILVTLNPSYRETEVEFALKYASSPSIPNDHRLSLGSPAARPFSSTLS